MKASSGSGLWPTRMICLLMARSLSALVQTRSNRRMPPRLTSIQIRQQDILFPVPPQLADEIEKLVDMDRLAQESVDFMLRALGSIFRIVRRRQHDHRDAAQAVIVSD